MIAKKALPVTSAGFIAAITGSVAGNTATVIEAMVTGLNFCSVAGNTITVIEAMVTGFNFCSVAGNTITVIEPVEMTVLFVSGESPVKLLEKFLYAECAVEAESMRLLNRGIDKKCNGGGGY